MTSVEGQNGYCAIKSTLRRDAMPWPESSASTGRESGQTVSATLKAPVPWKSGCSTSGTQDT
jgi:hypothetical protein